MGYDYKAFDAVPGRYRIAVKQGFNNSLPSAFSSQQMAMAMAMQGETLLACRRACSVQMHRQVEGLRATSTC